MRSYLLVLGKHNQRVKLCLFAERHNPHIHFDMTVPVIKIMRVLEKTLESPLDCKVIQPVHSEGDQPWDFFGRNDAKAETPVFWLHHVKS